MCGARHPYSVVFFFNDTATTEIYTLSLHDALPILYYLGIILAIEMDARRHETHTVAITTQSPWKLLLRFGYHFSSLAAIVFFLVRGYTPFRAVVYATGLPFLLGFLERRPWITPRRMWEGLAQGGT